MLGNISVAKRKVFSVSLIKRLSIEMTWDNSGDTNYSTSSFFDKILIEKNSLFFDKA